MLTFKDVIGNKFYSVFNYIEDREDLFTDFPLNTLDCLVFAQFSYLRLDKFVSTLDENKEWVKIKELYKAEEFEYLISKHFYRKENKQLIVDVCASPRFRDVEMNFHVDEYDRDNEKQFSAVTFKLPTNEIIVAFRGTDISTVGWKEDFNMMFVSPVPSQISATEYLTAVAEKTDGKIYTVGHSKGGNLALYSFAFCEKRIAERVETIYNFDGPGFPADLINDLEHNEYISKMKKFTPVGSLVGLLLDHTSEVELVKSYNRSFTQHNPFSWEVEGIDFVRDDKNINEINNFILSANHLIYSLEPEQRKIIIDTVFTIIYAINPEDINNLGIYAIKERKLIREAVKNLDEDTAKLVKQIIKRFFKLFFTKREEMKKYKNTLTIEFE